jgi:predicted glycogen debranching enzyme
MRAIDLTQLPPEERRRFLSHQWLVTNGLGGYASSTLAGAVTWRYHGLLVAALPSPFGRTVMLSHLAEAVARQGRPNIVFGGMHPGSPEQEPPTSRLVHFRLEHHLPCWRYEIDDLVIEKRLLMPYGQNTVHLTYTLLSDQPDVQLQLRPSIHFRRFEASVATPLASHELQLKGDQFEIHSHEGFPPLRLRIADAGSTFTYDCGAVRDAYYERDAARGYESRGQLWTPGFFTVALRPHQPATLIASTEDWHVISALTPKAALATEQLRRERLVRRAHPACRSGFGAELVLAADQFVIEPIGRIEAAARARALGDEVRSVIAGYHWFTDWGRDTMISLEGLTMTTGRHQEAAWILRTFAQYVRDGLIPNLFPEGKDEGLYHTADATLWFFHAVDRYVTTTGERETLLSILPALRSIIAHHVRGTRFGIGMDPEDGLLRQGEPGYQLTWMDAKVDDWVVTPRRGKAVEINALWYNALRLLSGWLAHQGDQKESEELAALADRARTAFNRRFWNTETNCLYDIVDGEEGEDPAIRPNQVFAISLRHPVLEPDKWASVLEVVEEQLLTPVGLRSLHPGHPDYKPTYSGDLRARDAAYHQGTGWGWLIGPFIDAWLKVHPGDRAGARKFLSGFERHLDEGCIGSISEVFDAEAPFTERGCVAQAWSVAEVLRCHALTAGSD